MRITVLKSKLKLVTVTQASVEYEGSITIDEDLMDAMGIREFERVEVNRATNPARIVTYAIKGKRGSGIIGMNGGAALHFKEGDNIHVLCYGEVEEDEDFSSAIIYTDANNKIDKIQVIGNIG